MTPSSLTSMTDAPSQFVLRLRRALGSRLLKAFRTVGQASVQILEQWQKLREQLIKDNRPSVMLIRTKMREVLGFTDRSHREWVPTDGYDGYGHYKNIVCLDFYDEPKRVFFLLKYGEFLQNESS